MERRSHLSIVPPQQPEQSVPGITPFVSSAQAEQDAGNREVEQIANRLLGACNSLLIPLEPLHADVMWGFFRLEERDVIAERTGLSIEEIDGVLESFEERIGGRLHF